MEEADALSTRIGIMINGRLVCLGSSQHLKSTHGGGFQVEIRTSGDLALQERLQSYVETSLTSGEGVRLLENFEGRLRFTIPESALITSSDEFGESIPHLAHLFGALEQKKQEFAITDYAISQSKIKTKTNIVFLLWVNL